MTEVREVVAQRGWDCVGRATSELTEVMEIFYSLIGVRNYAFARTLQTVHLRPIHFTVNNTSVILKMNTCIHTKLNMIMKNVFFLQKIC